MDAAATLAIGGLVTALAQVGKWMGLRDQYGPLALVLLSASATALWVYSKGTYDRTLLFDVVTGAASVMLTSAGIFGFTRSLPAAVTEGSRNSTIPGAGQNPTTKPSDSTLERRG
jgi:hypothetical protein